MKRSSPDKTKAPAGNRQALRAAGVPRCRCDQFVKKIDSISVLT